MVSLSLSFLLLCQGFTTLVLVNTFTYTHTQVPHTHTTTTKLAYTLPDSKWDSLQVPETLEPKWYILNCMATAEFTVLKNLEDHCTGATPDIIKFSVPTETKGTSRLKKAFTEEKPLFQGYVFVLCKLTRESYDTIAQVPSVRGWMGVPRKVRYKQLLPIPCPLEGSELKKFHLLETKQVQKIDAIATGIFNPKEPKELYDITHGFEVGQYVKVLAGPHTNEDAIVRKFRDGKIGVRMFTYGTQFDAMFDAQELRKLNELEVAAGFTNGDAAGATGSGQPTRSITQEEFCRLNGLPPPNNRKRGDFDNRSNKARVAARAETQGASRNRRQDRTSKDVGHGDMFGRSEEERKSEDALWDSYQTRGQGYNNNNNDYATNRPTADGSRKTRDYRIYDEDSNMNNRMGKTTTDVNAGEDDFFSELMNELADDLDLGGEKKNQNKQQQNERYGDDDDDFFAMLEKEMKSGTSNDSNSKKKSVTTSGSRNNNVDDSSSNHNNNNGGSMSEDDFFAALEQEMSSASASSTSTSTKVSDEDDDFFAALEKEMNANTASSSSSAPKKQQQQQQQDTTKSKDTMKRSSVSSADDYDFFTQLEMEMSNNSNNKPNEKETELDDDDFFASLDLSDAAVERDVSVVLESKSATISSKAKTSNIAKSTSSSPQKGTNIDSSNNNLSSMTVVQLKGLLREKGLPVSGKKAELITRLQQ